eukprot:7770260-Alexandrium_andersonii.AAC.1
MCIRDSPRPSFGVFVVRAVIQSSEGTRSGAGCVCASARSRACVLVRPCDSVCPRVCVSACFAS